AVGGVQVVVEDTARCCVTGVAAVVCVGLFRGIGAEQVVEGVPAGNGFGEQVRAGQFVQQRARPVRWDRGEAGCGGDGDVRAWVQSQQPEQPRRVGAQGAVRPGEYRSDVGGQITTVEGGVGGGARGGDGQCQGQPGAAGDDVVDRIRFAGDPVRPEAAGK